jgi:hypothetical protein
MRRRLRRLCLTGLLALCAGGFALLAGALAQATARADFGAPSLASGTSELQFDQADAPALAADGRYLVFQGTLAGVQGVYRRDLQTGEVEPVAVYEPPESPAAALSAPDATAPSVSADGRYVAFTTTAALSPEEPQADSGCPEVYVRDMDGAGPSAYTLAAALNGSDAGITYAGSCTSRTVGFALAGAQAAPAVAISADGQQVVFTVLSPSNLMSGGAVSTDPSQVVLRDLSTRTTTLVSATPEGSAPAGGGAFPSTQSESQAGARTVGPGQQQNYGDQLTASTAAISADGSSVAWLGTHVPAQVPAATDVQSGMTGELRVNSADPLGSEVEPLWRRVADGPGAVTRRLLGGAGLDFYFRSATTESGNPVLGGSFVGEQELLFIPPVLSADGETAAVLANAPPPASEGAIEAESNQIAPDTDAYVVRLDDDPSQPPQVTPITATADYAASAASVGDVKDVAISPDGSRVAFDTTRTQFTLPASTLISPPISYGNTAETYEDNLALGTLQRVTSTVNGSEPNGWAGLLSFAGEGQTLAFASQATNLFFGDSVPASEVYTVAEVPAGAAVAPQMLSAEPTIAPTTPDWLLSATAAAQADGSVIVYAQVPGAGGLGVRATAQLPAQTSRSASRARSRRARVSSTKRKAAKPPSKAVAKIPAVTVALAAAAVRGASEARLRVRLSARYRKLAEAKSGLYASLILTFTVAGHPPLTQRIPATFKTVKRASKTLKRASK